MKTDMIPTHDLSVGSNQIVRSAILIGIFAACYLAVLPMADTIAFRNLALGLLSVALAWYFLRVRQFHWTAPPLVC